MAVWGAVQQEEAGMKYQSSLTLIFPVVILAHSDLLIDGAALEEEIRIHLPHSCTQICLHQTHASSHITTRLY